MLRIEVIDRWFFPSPVRRDGKIIPAPQEAVEKYTSLKKGWLKEHPVYPHEEPMVSIAPGKVEGQEGYFVRTEIMYKNQ